MHYIRRYETAWNFEWWGSKRAAILNPKFYVLDRNWVKTNEFEIIPYIFTGVIGGKWFREVIELFDKNNIKMDFSRRGFYESQKRTFWKKNYSKTKNLPQNFLSYSDLILLKIATIIKIGK